MSYYPTLSRHHVAPSVPQSEYRTVVKSMSDDPPPSSHLAPVSRFHTPTFASCNYYSVWQPDDNILRWVYSEMHSRRIVYRQRGNTTDCFTGALSWTSLFTWALKNLPRLQCPKTSYDLKYLVDRLEDACSKSLHSSTVRGCNHYFAGNKLTIG